MLLCVQDSFICLAEQRQFSAIEQLMKTTWIRPLRHLIVVLCWDFCETPTDAQRLVSCGVSTIVLIQET